MKEISKLTILTKKEIYEQLERLFGKDDSANKRCYNCIKHHMCPLSEDDPYCTACVIDGVDWLYIEDYEVGE